MSLDRQTEALLALVDADRERKCDAIVGEAKGRAAALLAEAHADARKRMRQMFHEERERMAQRVAAANARLSTRRRLADQQRAAAYLAAGWQRLPEELRRRWLDETTRRGWVAAVVARAHSVLAPGPWHIVHAADWPATERDALAAELVRGAGVAPTFRADDKVRAGLKIGVDGNVVDGTLAGLLIDRSEIGSRLLRELET